MVTGRRSAAGNGLARSDEVGLGHEVVEPLELVDQFRGRRVGFVPKGNRALETIELETGPVLEARLNVPEARAPSAVERTSEADPISRSFSPHRDCHQTFVLDDDVIDADRVFYSHRTSDCRSPEQPSQIRRANDIRGKTLAIA